MLLEYISNNHEVVELKHGFDQKKTSGCARLFYASYHPKYYLAICRLSDQLSLLR